MTIILTENECKALHGLIDGMSGGNPENVFAWDGTDDMNEPVIAAAAKIYQNAGEKTPWFDPRKSA